MSKTSVICIAKTESQAIAIVDRLKAAQFSSSDISVLFPDKSGTKDFAHEQNTKAPEGATTGGVTGGLLGGALGWLVGIGALAIPGVGPFIAAGPIMALYFLAIALPKLEFVGTSAWFFLVINCFKVPFSVALGLIHPDSLAFNAALVPAIIAGLFAGRWMVTRIPQKLFDGLLLAFAAAAALRLVGLF